MPVISNNNTGTVGAVLKVDNLIYNFYTDRAAYVEYVKENPHFPNTHNSVLKNVDSN